MTIPFADSSTFFKGELFFWFNHEHPDNKHYVTLDDYQRECVLLFDDSIRKRRGLYERIGPCPLNGWESNNYHKVDISKLIDTADESTADDTMRNTYSLPPLCNHDLLPYMNSKIEYLRNLHSHVSSMKRNVEDKQARQKLVVKSTITSSHLFRAFAVLLHMHGHAYGVIAPCYRVTRHSRLRR